MQQKAVTVPSMDARFMRWAALTDAYAEQVEAMARQEPGARAEAQRLCRELRGMRPWTEPPPLPN
ncbi:hypothetical protein [Xenophilus sp. Marseille-Q4582]|uniref:hypothetical protein n=1 Tax=Xenophilus sp. Marseille-Q4582 TaxID=2866600 RepID=UPI001CE3F319|nr:hypothetical protein [Xenophilus sp. Marseille-Q4582]